MASLLNEGISTGLADASFRREPFKGPEGGGAFPRAVNSNHGHVQRRAVHAP